MNRKLVLMLGGLILLTGIGAVVIAVEKDDDDEESSKVAYASLPEAVRKAAEKHLGGPGDYKAETEKDEGVTWYEVEATKDGKEISLKLTENGEIVEIENSIPFDQLPAAAQKELKKDYPKADFTEVESVQLHYYEVEVKVDGKKKEVKVFASGDIEDDDDDDKEDKD